MFRILLIAFFLTVFLASATVPEGITDTVVLNPAIVFAPNDVASYLRSGVHYGGERSSLAADKLLGLAASWKLPIYDYQLVKREQDEYAESSATPGTTDTASTWQDDAYSIYESCVSSGQDQSNQMNTQCGVDCTKTNMMAAIWGTLQGMNWTKDGIFFQTCSIISVVHSDPCFTNFPFACSIEFEADLGPLFGPETIKSGDVVEFGTPKPKTRTQLIQELQAYAQSSHKPITIPQ